MQVIAIKKNQGLRNNDSKNLEKLIIALHMLDILKLEDFIEYHNLEQYWAEFPWQETTVFTRRCVI